MTEQNNVILGAGLAGLSAACHLRGEHAVYEQNPEVGGLCRSEEADGFIFDYAPHILYTINPYASQLIHRLLKGNLHIQDREAYIYHGRYDVYTRFPFQAHLHGLPWTVVFDCLSGLVAALRDQDRPRPKNYREWIYARFGKGIAEHLMIPYAERIWTIDPALMNFDWIDRRVPEPDFNVILKGALMDEKKRTGFNNDFWYPTEGGIEALPRALARDLKTVHVNRRATRIFPDKKIVEFNGLRTERVKYERLISTLPLPAVIGLIEDAPSGVKAAAAALQNNSIVCVNLGVDRPDVSPYHWLYFYERDFIFHRMSFPMNLSRRTTPDGQSSMTCEIAHSRFRPLDVSGEGAIVERTVADLVKAGILRPDDNISVSQVLDIDPAYVIYDLDHRRNVDAIHAYLREKDILPCGRFGEWEYLNMDHSILSGKRAAEEINTLAGGKETQDNAGMNGALELT